MPHVEIEGLKGLTKEIKGFEDGIKDLKKLHKEAAEIVATTAHTIVPVLTGRLDASIKASGTQAGGKVKAGSKGVPYGAVQHFGWLRHHIAPKPFLYQALDSRADEIVEKYNDGLAALIDKNFKDGVHG